MDKVMLILKLLPAIVAGIKALEEAIPGQGKGEQKLAALREILELVDGTVSSVWPQIAAVVAVLVKTMNSTGALK